MALTVTKTGPFFNGTNAPSNTTNMKFSQLRDTFRLNNTSGAISASELLRDIDTANSTDPIVPDATENVAIAANPINTASNWKVSQFQGAIKFFDIEQDASDNNANFNISAITQFNNNLGKTIKKKLILRGTHTSTNTADAAAKILTDVFNLTLEIHGVFYGAGGVGGTSSSLSGTNGGAALSINGGRVTVDIKSSGRLWGGGGGGEFGGDGSAGAKGSCFRDNTISTCGGTLSCPPGQVLTNTWTGGCCELARYCAGPWQSFCHNYCVRNTSFGNCRETVDSLLPPLATGGNGGAGRGFNNFTGSLLGSSGANGVCPSCADSSFTLVAGSGTCSGDGQDGGTGGEWGLNGTSTTAAGSGGIGGKAIIGTGYTVLGNNSNTVRGGI